MEMEESFSRSVSEVEEHEVFEITDFTTASDWEKFVAKVSEAIIEWKLNRIENLKPLEPNDLSSGSWETTSVDIRFSSVVFTFTLHRLKQSEDVDIDEEFKDSDTYDDFDDELRTPCYLNDLMTTTNDFPPRAHCLARWYGLRCFCILNLTQPKNSSITSESKSNLLLSSICTVLSECNCETPIFVQIQDSWRRMYSGRCVGSGMQTNFEMVHLRKCPPQFQKLSGLLHVFKNKIGAGLPINPCLVSARFTYVLNDWGVDGAWPSSKINSDAAASKLDDFLFGLVEECIPELHLYTTWPSVSEDMIVENDVHSDFYPLRAPHWSIRLRYADDTQGFLTSYVSEFLKLRSCESSVNELISVAESTDSDQDLGLALQKLTNPGNLSTNARNLAAGLTKIVEAPRTSIGRRLRRSHVKSKGPLSQETLEAAMEYLFPESKTVDTSQDNISQEREFQKLKSAPINSLSYKLAICMTVINYCHGGVQGVAQLWHEFVQEMRYRLENSELLPTVEGNPDLRACLLHQKFQMLNCCISHKLNRENPIIQNIKSVPQETDPHIIHPVASTTSFLSTTSSIDKPTKENIISDEEDEFFECESSGENEESLKSSEEEETKVEIVEKDDKDKGDSVMDVSEEVAYVADGRLKKFDDATLLNSNESLYIPITQQSAPLTEDALEEQTKIFSSLGDSPEGASLRLKMQSASLFSDMETFKAANPGCVLEDFVRWYSPRDFIPASGNKKGGLSERMKLPGNMWLSLWQSAKPIPVRRQKRLFDDTKEGEKVMLFLSSLNPSEVCRHLLPMCFHHALSIFREKSVENSLPGVSKICDQVFNQMAKLFFNLLSIKSDRLDDIVRQFQFIEMLIERTQSLRHKFKGVDDSQNFVNKLLENPEIQLENGASGQVGKILQHYFKQQQLRLREKMLANMDTAPNSSLHPDSPKSMTPADILPVPAGKEFILRTEAPRPATQSRVLPHKMYTVLANQEFRLAGAFSCDTVFF